MSLFYVLLSLTTGLAVFVGMEVQHRAARDVAHYIPRHYAAGQPYSPRFEYDWDAHYRRDLLLACSDVKLWYAGSYDHPLVVAAFGPRVAG